ncbi:MAG: ubiquinol-cytochrome c reductase iron-sulfur subunit [Ignavibacteria bacterium]
MSESPSIRPVPNLAERARRRFLLRVTAAVGGVYTAAAAWPFLASLAPSARARAEGAPVEADLAGIAPGELQVVAWRGKPVWVLRRTPEMLAALAGHDAELADPNSDQTSQQPAYCRNATRAIQPEWFVCIGICTHLGCSPTLVPREASGSLGPWPGGFLCPCHGSKFDLAGRVFRNVPAPTNLEIPPYRYLTPTRLRIGEESGSA